MKSTFLKLIAPRLAALAAAMFVVWFPALEPMQDGIASTLLFVWGCVELIVQWNRAQRKDDMKELQSDVGVEPTGKFDAKFSHKLRKDIPYLPDPPPLPNDLPVPDKPKPIRRDGGNPAK